MAAPTACSSTRLLIAGLGALILSTAAAPAGADGIAPAKDDDGETPVAPAGDLDAPADPAPRHLHSNPSQPHGAYYHDGQFGLAMRVPLGLRALAPYGDTDYCGVDDDQTQTHNAAVCVGRAPFSVDVDLSYGVTRKLELFLEVRLGLEHDFAATLTTVGSGPRVHFFAPGVRWFFNEAYASKLFTTAQIVLDTTSYQDGGGSPRGVDVGFRNMNGLWFDPGKNYGFYGFVAETLTGQRWLRFELEAGIGFQARILD